MGFVFFLDGADGSSGSSPSALRFLEPFLVGSDEGVVGNWFDLGGGMGYSGKTVPSTSALFPLAPFFPPERMSLQLSGNIRELWTRK
jgi:hypothetical protein